MGWVTLTLYIYIHYIRTQEIEGIQNYFLSNFSLSCFLALSGLLHILAARNPRIFWPPTQKGKKGGARNQRPHLCMPPFCAPPLGCPRGVPHSIFYFFGGFIKSASRSQKVDFRSDREGVQIEEKSPIEKIYKAAAMRKAVLLQRISSPSREFSSLTSWWEVLHTSENVAQ